VNYSATPHAGKKLVSSIAGGSASDLACNWLELEFYTVSQQLKGQISCPDGMRILDILNTPLSQTQNIKVEFIELIDYLETETNCGKPKKVYIKKDDVLFISAPDENTGRGLGAKGESKVYPFVPKTPTQVSIQLPAYSIDGNVFRAKNQSVLDLLNEAMLFLPLTDAVISKDCRYWIKRPFVAVNKRQITECREPVRD
jgi:hypothetical protein